MSELTIKHALSDDGSILKISVSGKLAIDTAEDLKNLLVEKSGMSNSIQIDLSELKELDIIGIQLICSACHTNLNLKKHFNFTGSMGQNVKAAVAVAGLGGKINCKYNYDLPCIWSGGIN